MIQEALLSNLHSAVKYYSPSDLLLNPKNPRKHSQKQVRQIARSIQEFGFTNPILISKNKEVLAGHGRVLAAKQLNMPTVPTLVLSHLSEAQKKAYIIADNKLAENSGWDVELLKIELEELLLLDEIIDVNILGFDTGEVDFILDESDISEISEPAPPEVPITKKGDLWCLGDHRILCGDALIENNFSLLLGTKKADMVFIDPPYNVPIAGHVSGNGKVKHDEFAMASGEMSSNEFFEFLNVSFLNLQNYSKKGSIHFVCMDWRHLIEALNAGRSYTEMKNLCVWNKTTGGMGSLYRSQHELVLVFKHGKEAHTNNINLGRHGRNRTNVWDYPGVNNFRHSERIEALAIHPTVKPTALIADAIKDCSNRKDIILDCFGGSGSTLLAAEQTGRLGYLVEYEAKYVDVAIERYQKLTGHDAVLATTGERFNDLKRRAVS